MRSFVVSNSSVGEGRFAEYLGEQLECLRQGVAFGVDGEAQLPGGTATASTTAATSATPAATTAATGADADAERVEFFAQGLPIVFLRAGHHQARQHAGRRRVALQRLLIAVMKVSTSATVSPRFFFASRPAFRPLVLTILTRASRFAGEGSNSSPASATVPPW